MTTTTATGRPVATSGAIPTAQRYGRGRGRLHRLRRPVPGRNFTNSFLELGIGHLGLSYLATLVFVVGALLSGKGLLDARRTTGSS